MDVVAAVVATVVLAGLSVVQFLVATGRPYGRFVWGGRHDVLPPPLRRAALVSIVVYVAMAAVLVARVTSDPVPSFVRIATWCLVGYFVLGAGMNAISRSRSERAVMTPVALVLAACALVLATS